MVQENHSFRSNDRSSQLIQSCFEPKFRCAWTKTQSVITNVITHAAITEFKEHLSKSKLIFIFTDALNHMGILKYFQS